MKKIFPAAVLICVLFFSCGAEAVAPLSDMDGAYVRRDVYQSDLGNLNGKLDNLDKKMDNVLAELKAQREDINKLAQSVAVLSERIEGVNKSLSVKIDEVDKRLSDKIDEVNKRLSDKIDSVDKKLSVRMDDLRNGLYLAIAFVAMIILLPFVKNWYDERAKQKLEALKPLFTLDDVKKLIEENNAMLLAKLQGGAV